MTEPAFFLAAKDASIDTHTNRVSIFNIYDDISIPNGDSVVLPQVTLFCLLYIREEERDEEFRYSATVVTPNDEEEEEVSSLRVDPTGPRHRVVSKIANLTLEGSGELIFHAYVGEDRVSSYNINVDEVEVENNVE